MTPTKDQLTAGFNTVVAIAESIRKLKQVPAGTIYAAVMGKISHESFEKIIGMLVSQKLVRREPSHLLVWIGPA